MNTTPDDLQQQGLMVLLKQAEPSWKLNPLPKDPVTEVFTKPVAPRRAQFSFSDPFGPIVTGTSGSGGGSSSGPNLIQVTVTGVYNGTPVTGVAAYFVAPS